MLYINSPGGSVKALLGIYDTMRYIRCDVATTCLGWAASAAAVVLAAGAPGKRAALPHSTVLLHQPHGGAQGQSVDIDIQAREILRQRVLVDEILYLAVVDLTARINPARSSGHTYTCLRAAQSLASEARALLAALELMWDRGEREIHVPTLTQALRALDGERRASRVTIPS